MSDEARPNYQTCAGDVARDRAAVMSVWHGNLGLAARHAGKYDWFYQACPFGQPLVQLLRHAPTDRWVGISAVGPRRMLWQGREIRAGVLVDMAVAASHRTLGPAMMLQSALVTAASGQFELLYGFPNRKSLPVVKRLGYSELGQLPRYTRVLHYRDYLGRVVPHWLVKPAAWLLDGLTAVRDLLHGAFRAAPAAQWQAHVDPRMDELWRESPHGTGPITVRDCAFLRWRFDQAPLVQTRYLLLSDATSRLRAWFACQVDGATLHVRDFWSAEAASGVLPAHVHALLRAARSEGHGAVSVEHAGAVTVIASWQAAGFRQRGQRPVIGRWLGNVQVIPAGTSLHLTAADEDE